MDAVLPPKIKLPEQMKVIGVMDRSQVKLSDKRSGSGSEVSAIDAARNTMINDIKNGLPLAEVRLEKPRPDGHTRRSAEPIRPENIRSYANNADGLFCLDEYDFQEQRNYKDIRKNQLDKDGKTYTIDAVAATRLIYLRTLWRLYDGRTGQVMLEIPQYSEDKYETEGLTRQGVNAHLDTTETVTPSTLSRQLSRSIIQDINPKEITSSWKYYRKGHDVIENSASYIKRGEFRNAVEYLSKNVKTISSEKLKLRASYNLIVAYYFNRQREEALRLATYEYNRTNKKEFRELYDKIYIRG